MILALYCPDIAQNAGTTLRTGACLGVPVHIIEPAGFPVGAAAFRRAGMDYLDAALLVRHASFAAFEASRRAEGRRLVLFTTAGETRYTDFVFAPTDALLFGRESQGVPQEVHALADARVTIPLRPGLRSLNVAVSAAMGLGEALRQTGGFPPPVGSPVAPQG
ncbi:tRNA (cytidine(34)-2'-O)-methyltransferase [Xanthobacter tagetidis]|uniref:tRNA (cytidine(34)-2'-O)-methyltransferase n=1 Tax=Xanthobacter tagetidis TaxID=60216 RepID=A0A3L7AA05_9HYPH|nr:tRNA (cytidine(34)-2'-O)-methyltransferase [Xanthobacter tagetidis]MBB6308354.1 tRNA (cytidine/uridine-2'-O-)-methyltransferase [Xanthobacter tagetidis]RLP76222.1 tRNA (cytidine(34)-2'-O)-methyltransferase [Xanthobacter tagetidis]